MKRRDIKILIYIGLILVCLLTAYFLIRPSILEVQYNQKDLKEKKLTLEKKEDYLQKFKEVSRKYKKNRGSIKKVNQLLLSEVNLPLILIQLEALATNTKVEIESIYFSPLEMSDKEIGVIPVTINTRSKYVPFKNFLNAIAKNLNIIEVENITLETERTMYLASLGLNVYTNVLPEVETAPIPTAEQTLPTE